MKMFTYIMLCTAGIITAGCSSMPFTGPKTDKTEVVKLSTSIPDTIPEWFLAKETKDTKEIVVTATDTSKDMQFAIDKATLSAKIQLAARLGTKVESLVRESALESGTGVKDVEREIDRVSRVRVTQNLNMFKRENLFVVREGDYFRAYVMLKLSTEDAHRLTQKDNSKSREERLKGLDEVPKTESEVPAVVVKPVA